MHWFQRIIIALFFLPIAGFASEQRGFVRAADQPVPGAMVTARKGEAKVLAYTDEDGQYVQTLAPGTWDV